MSATMARQGGQVQLEHSDICLALNMAKMANRGSSRAPLEKKQHLIRKPHPEVRDERKRGVEFPGHKRVKAAIERQPAMVIANHMDCCLSCQYGTARNPQTGRRQKGTGAPPPEWAAPPPAMPSAPPGDIEDNDSDEIDGMPSSCVYIHSPLPKTQFLNHNA